MVPPSSFSAINASKWRHPKERAEAIAIATMLLPTDTLQRELVVWVTIYTHEHGIDVAIHPSSEAAINSRAGTARDNWQDRHDRSAPNDHVALTDDEVDEAYWNGHDSEWYEIEQRTLTPTKPTYRLD